MLVNFILAGGMTLLLIITVFLWRFRRTLPFQLLSFFFVSIFFFLLYYFGYLHRSRIIGGIAFTFGNGAGLMWGPLFLHYIQSLVFPKKKVLRSLGIQLIPFFLNFLCISLPRGANMCWGIFPDFTDWYLRYAEYLIIAENIWILVYFVLCLRLLRRIRVWYRSGYSHSEGHELKWCGQLIYTLSFIVMADIACSLYEMNYPPIVWNIGMVPAFMLVLLTGVFAYKGMWQVQFLLPDFLLEKPENDHIQMLQEETPAIVQEQNRAALSNLSVQEIDDLKKRLNDLMEREKPYLNDSLTLSDLALSVGITDKKLSELLNQHLHVSFYDLINHYRVLAVKEKMQDPASARYTLLSIAFECGFKSKTSFNRVFKQKTGVSPSVYFQKRSD